MTSKPSRLFVAASYPQFFMQRSLERACIDPDQLLIFMDHVRCAAFELPFQDGEHFGSQPLTEMLTYLEGERILHHEGAQWRWIADSYPANSVSLHSVAEGNFVVDTTGGQQKIIAEVDYSSAALTLYEGAIYLVQASPGQVERLDWTGRKTFVTKTRADYYTDAPFDDSIAPRYSGLQRKRPFEIPILWPLSPSRAPEGYRVNETYWRARPSAAVQLVASWRGLRPNHGLAASSCAPSRNSVASSP